jgi:hypothetical protein
MQMAIDKAKRHGVGFVAVKNSTHYGIAGYYATMATEAGCIGWTGTNARPSIAPTFGVEPCLGTNPLCFGIPTDEDFPFVIDCATSINQRGKRARVTGVLFSFTILHLLQIGRNSPLLELSFSLHLTHNDELHISFVKYFMFVCEMLLVHSA